MGFFIEVFMKNTINVIFFIGIIVITQFLLTDYINYSPVKYLSIFLSVSVVLIGAVIFLENRNPSQTVAWLVILASVPYLGFVFYLLFGRYYRKERKIRRKYTSIPESFTQLESAYSATLAFSKEFSDDKLKMMYFAKNISNSPISFATDSDVLTNGEQTFDSILEALRNAKHHIHLEYYIVRNDGLGNQIKDLLIEKAREGVEVRFLIDDVGSVLLSKRYIKALKDAGVRVRFFNEVRIPLFNNKLNFRNHRKIVIVDGHIGFVGGLNIGDEYLSKSIEYGFWRDTHLKIIGESVGVLQLIFLQDWYYMTKEVLSILEYLPITTESQVKNGGVQIIAGGPDNRETVIKDLYFSMITTASTSVWIASPYFIPDADITTALKIAARSGVDVRLLVPNKADHHVVFYASRSYFEEFLEAGVKIYEYQKGFMHSKFVIIDGEVASIGTANMDMRSFHLNFEVNACLYKTDSVNKLGSDYLEDISNSVELNLDGFGERSFIIRIVESLARLVSPLL